MTSASTLATFLYLRLGDPMPEPILNEDEEIDAVADNLAIETWSAMPDVFSIDVLRLQRFLDDLEILLVQLETRADDHMTLFYDAAKNTFDHDKKQIRTWFSWLYLILFHQPAGPRWGELVSVLGTETFIELVRTRLRELV